MRNCVGRTFDDSFEKHEGLRQLIFFYRAKFGCRKDIDKNPLFSELMN